MTVELATVKAVVPVKVNVPCVPSPHGRVRSRSVYRPIASISLPETSLREPLAVVEDGMSCSVTVTSSVTADASLLQLTRTLPDDKFGFAARASYWPRFSDAEITEHVAA